MYKLRRLHKTRLTSTEILEGEPIELKIERILNNNEPITDGAPEIFTERKDGVVSAYNIRTDRWEIACDGMSQVEKSITAKREHKAKKKEEEKPKKETKVIDLNKSKDNGVKPTNGTTGD
jgi:hypothetical protein